MQSVQNVSVPVKVEHVHTHSSTCFTPAKLKWYVHAMAAIWIIFSLLPKGAITELHCSQEGERTMLCGSQMC
jgi:hypothetical protein